ncbi:hypothetical protein SEA_LUCKYLEO_51 [Gordonia phage LuckyLeo]|nr:hypothetical protein SEA_LUCKYLEO_51 [Gordonia phage LuckyLeo]
MRVIKPIPMDHELYGAMANGHLVRTGHQMEGYLVSEDGEVWHVARQCCGQIEKLFTYDHTSKDDLPFPQNDDERCYHYKWLDQHFGTDTDSPLHHHHRCVKCGQKRRNQK